MKVVGVAFSLACLVVISIFCLGNKIHKEREIKEFLRKEISKDCYVKGDNQNNFICDCFIEETLKRNNPYTLLAKYKEDAFSVIEKITTDYFEVCLNKTVKAKFEGKI